MFAAEQDLATLLLEKQAKVKKLQYTKKKNGWLRIGTDEWIYNEPSYIVYTKDKN